MKRLITLAITVVVVTASAAMPKPKEPDPPDPPKPRSWAVRVEGWHPTREDRWLRLDEMGRMQARLDDRRVIERVVGEILPNVNFATRIDLTIQLGRGQHRNDDRLYWPAVKDAMLAIGLRTTEGLIEFTRSDVRGDIATTVIFTEVR